LRWHSFCNNSVCSRVHHWYVGLILRQHSLCAVYSASYNPKIFRRDDFERKKYHYRCTQRTTYRLTGRKTIFNCCSLEEGFILIFCTIKGKSCFCAWRVWRMGEFIPLEGAACRSLLQHVQHCNRITWCHQERV